MCSTALELACRRRRRLRRRRPAPSGRRPPCRTSRCAAGVAARRAACGGSDGTSSARNPPKLSELTSPSATSSASASSTCGAQQAGAVDQLVEERGAVLADEVGDRLRRVRSADRLGASADSDAQSGACGAAAARSAWCAPAPAGALCRWHCRCAVEPRPGNTSGEAVVIEPRRLVTGKPRRQDLGFPGAGRRFEAFELPDDCIEGVRSFHARVRRHPLPGEQEAQEVARRDRLDLRAQPLDGVAMNARQQPALAPFFRRRRRA